jgi:hypothetical protein
MPTPQEIWAWLNGPTAWDQARGVPGGPDAQAGGPGGPGGQAWPWPYASDPRNPAQQSRVLRAQQDQRRYGGAPAGRGYDDFMQRAQIAQYGPWLANQMGGMPPTRRNYGPVGAQGPEIGPTSGLNAAPDPNAWAQGAMWQYRPGGPGMLANVPPEAWPDYMDQMDASLPWAQLYQQDANSQAARDQWLMDYQRQGNQWQQQFGAGQDQASFDRWLAQQQLALQGGQQGADNAWRQRQLDLQAQLQGFQMGPQWQQQVGQQNWQNQFQDRDWTAQQAQQQWANQFNRQQFDTGQQNWQAQFGAGRDDEMWRRGFQGQQFGEDTRRWDLGFNAGRDDEMWNRGFQRDQFGEDTRRWDADFARNQALDQWNQSFSQGQFDWQKQRGIEQDALAREGQAMGAFGRRFGPSVGSM